ncbi:hypothetical protein ACUIAJ_03495 [Dermabacteraceae bacterium CCM 9519]
MISKTRAGAKRYSYRQATIVALAIWAAQYPFLLIQGFPWYAYAASGLILLGMAYAWSLLLRKDRIEGSALMPFAVASAIVLLVSLGIFVWG